MGIKHATRLEEALRLRLRDLPDLDDFFDESLEERFFVKNLERVQGDERDAIILPVGYGKNAANRLVHRFGPLLMQGGERRLNVSVTRAKVRDTLVTSFSDEETDPERLAAEGMSLIHQYLRFVGSGGSNLGDRVVDKPALNPLRARCAQRARAVHAPHPTVRDFGVLDRLRGAAHDPAGPLRPGHRMRRRDLSLGRERASSHDATPSPSPSSTDDPDS